MKINILEVENRLSSLCRQEKIIYLNFLSDANTAELGGEVEVSYLLKPVYDEESEKDILPFDGIKKTIFLLRCVDDKNAVLSFCADIAESVIHLYDGEDSYVRDCIDNLRLFINGDVDENELKAFRMIATNKAKLLNDGPSKHAAFSAINACYAAEQVSGECYCSPNSVVDCAILAQSDTKTEEEKLVLIHDLLMLSYGVI